MEDWLVYLGGLLVNYVVVLALIPVVLLRRKEPSAKLAWIFALVLMPVFGTIWFLLFGTDRLTRKTKSRRLRKQKVRLKVGEILGHIHSPVDIVGQLQLYKLLQRINPMPPTKGNAVQIYEDMELNYATQLAAIAGAKQHVHIAYYIFRLDRIGERFRDALIAAARRGVKVRLLYDGIGGLQLTRRFLKQLRAGGIEVACFLPFSLFTRRWAFNFRNHRKILVVDGNVGFIGGANVGIEYLGESAFGGWADTHLKIVGPAVLHIQQVFVEDWAYATDAPLGGPEIFPETTPAGDVVAQVIPGGPDTDVPIYHELYFAAAANAVERIRITTPYLVPSDPICLALQTAARRGVDVQIMIPQKADHRLVQWAGRSYHEELLEAGVKIFEYHQAFLHSKILTVDNRWSIVGTANFDNRSMRLNFEIGVAFYDVDLTQDLDSYFERKLTHCVRIDSRELKKKALWRRILENVARLFAPVL